MSDVVQGMKEKLNQERLRQQERIQSRSSSPTYAHSNEETAESVDLRAQISDLESQLAASSTVSHFYEQRAKLMEEEKRANETREKNLAVKLEAARKQLVRELAQAAEAGSSSSSSSSSSTAATIQNLEGRLRETIKLLESKERALMDTGSKAEALEIQCVEQARLIEQLREDAKNAEDKLNQSYITTLDELTSNINYLQDALKESQDALREAENAMEAAEEKLAQVQNKSRNAIGPSSFTGGGDQNLQEQILTLESKLAVQTKVADFLQKQMAGTSKAVDMESLTAAVSQSQQQQRRSVQPNDAENEELIQKAKEGEIKISDLEFKLSNTKRSLKFAESQVLKVQESSDKTKLTLGQEITDLKNQLLNQKRTLNFMEKKVVSVQDGMKKEQEASNVKIFDLEYKLSNSQRTLNFLKPNMEKSHAEKVKLQTKVGELQVKLETSIESNKSMETAMNKLKQEKEDLLSQVNTLKKELQSGGSATRGVVIVPQSPAAQSNNNNTTTGAEVQELRSRLVVMNQVAEMLQMSVNKAEKEKRVIEGKVMQLSQELGQIQATSHEHDKEAEIKISDLEFKLTDAKRVLKSLLDKYNKAQKESKQEVENLSLENENLRYRLGQAKLVVDHLQERSTQSQQELEEKEQEETRPEEEFKELENQVSELEFKLSGIQRVKKFLEDSMIKTKEQNGKLTGKVKTLEEERDGLQSKYETEVQKYKKEIEDLQERVSIADRVGDFLNKHNPVAGTSGSGGDETTVEDTYFSGGSGETLEGTWVP